MKIDSRLPPVAEDAPEQGTARAGADGASPSALAPARALSVSPQLEALGSGTPRRPASAFGGGAGLGGIRSRAALPEKTRAQPAPQRMTLAQLFEQEDREARAQAAFNQPLGEIGEEEVEEDDDETESGNVAPTHDANAEPPRPNVTKQDHIPLAGYLLGRAVDGRPVPEHDVQRLRSAHESVVQTRQLLRWGRGNVRQDNAATGNESLARSFMAQNLALDLAQKEQLKFEDAPELAGAAMFAEAGTCREHAVVAMHLHANKLEGSTHTVHLASRPGVNHTWSEVRTQGKRERDRAIVMDPWGEGSAVLSEDARHTRVSIGIRSDGHYDAASGPRASEHAESAKQTLARDTPADTLGEFRSALAERPLPKRALFDAQPVVHRAFARRVEQKLSQPITATEAQNVARRTGPLGKAARWPLFAALRRNPFQSKNSGPAAKAPAAPPEAKGGSQPHRSAKAQSRADLAAAERKFAAAQVGVRNEIKAIGIARSLGLANTVAEAVDDAKAIVEAARHLRRTNRADTLPAEAADETPPKQR
jgi:hypothetical protein